jgi:hypothetical protein
MIVVIQCAARKRPGAGHLVSKAGRPVLFVAHPELAPAGDHSLYARPDDGSETEQSWRQVLEEYNANFENNPLGLYRAYRLYENSIYGRLVDRFGPEKVYILSAGWGLIRAEYLTPCYDITFSQSAEPYKRRRTADRFLDFRPNSMNEETVFFGGKDYLPLFCSLTDGFKAKKIVFYNSIHAPHARGCLLVKYGTDRRTNWHYECADAFLEGVIRIP